MLFRKLFTASTLAAVVLSVASAASPVSAKSSAAAAATCDPSYATAWGTWAAGIKGAIDPAKPVSYAPVLLSTIKTRNQYEDSPAPVGCEAIKPQIIQYLALSEDSLYTDLALAADPAVSGDATAKADYTEVSTKLTTDRINAMYPLLSKAYPAVDAPPAAPAAAATAAAVTLPPPTVCTDKAFAAQLKADTAILSLTKNVALWIKLRYKYEDLTPPATCADGRALVLQVLTISEDFAALTLTATVDKANAATYTDFLNNVVYARYTPIGQAALLAFPSLAPAPATAAPTASS